MKTCRLRPDGSLPSIAWVKDVHGRTRQHQLDHAAPPLKEAEVVTAKERRYAADAPIAKEAEAALGNASAEAEVASMTMVAALT